MREEEFYKELETLSHQIPAKYHRLLVEFFDAYKRAVLSIHDCLPTLFLYLLFIKQEIQSPFTFEPYHKKVRHPFDYYRFGTDFIKPLVDLPHSKIQGVEHLNAIARLLQKKENVILLANHQTESDPQAISILLEKTHPEIGSSIIYVAGERVVTDPLAIPFSMGCDLLCIYSKRYIDQPPEKKTDKQLHNKKTMQLMSRLLEEGGKIIYVAPSGGRDRKNKDGVIEVALFDPDSIEMFYLMARKSGIPTHFVPFTLATYALLPPPETIQHELGEARNAKRTPIHIAFAPPFDMNEFPGFENPNKLERREARAKAIWNIVCNTYQNLIK
jgi:glycerol-3-phosphate O-acyltransferase